MLVVDNWRLRRRLRVDQIAREAEDALGPAHIGDIVMPEPSDPRWKRQEKSFQDGKYTCLVLGHILIREGILGVYIGHGDTVPDGKAYAKRVLNAYRRRLAEESRGAG